MKLKLVLALSLLYPMSAFAQHSVTLNHDASPTTGIAGYNFYRAPCTGTVSAGTCSVAPPQAAFVKVNPAPVAGLNFADATVTAGGKYVWAETSVCPNTGCSSSVAGESVFSNFIASTVPTDNPLPGPNLTIGAVALLHLNPNKDQVTATWQDTSANSRTSFALLSDGRKLKWGTLSNNHGTYTATWSGNRLSVPAQLLVCNASGVCRTASSNS